MKTMLQFSKKIFNFNQSTKVFFDCSFSFVQRQGTDISLTLFQLPSITCCICINSLHDFIAHLHNFSKHENALMQTTGACNMQNSEVFAVIKRIEQYLGNKLIRNDSNTEKKDLLHDASRRSPA